MYGIEIDNDNTDWRRLLEACKSYIAIITEGWFEDPYCIEQTLYAKERHTPTILLWMEGVEAHVPDLFDGMDIRAKIIFNEQNKYEMKDKLLETLKQIEKEESES